MLFKNTIVILLMPVFFSGCYAYKVFPKNYRAIKTPEPTTTVYIINPELIKEYSILKNAGIYVISNDSSSSIKIKLYPLKHHFVCGQPLLSSMITLGQLPVYLPDTYQFSYEEQKGEQRELFSYELKIAKRYWFWDMFTFQKNFKTQAGKALAGNHYDKNATPVQ